MPPKRDEKGSMLARTAQQTSVYAITMLLGRMASLFLLPIYTRKLVPAEYGALEIIDLSSMMLSSILNMGIAGDAFFYFYAGAEDDEKKKHVVSAMITIGVLLGLAGGGALVVFAPWIGDFLLHTREFTTGIRIAGVAFVFGPPLDLAMCKMRADGQSGLFAMVSMTRLFATIALNLILLLGFGLGINALLASNCVVAAALMIWVLGRSARRGEIGWSADLALGGRIARYSAPLGISGLSLLAVHYADRYFLTRTCTLAEVGIYSLAYKFGMLVSQLNVPFQMFWRSQMYTLAEGQDFAEVHGKALKYLSYLFIYVGTGFFLLGQDLVRLAAANTYWEAARYVPWVALAYVVFSIERQLHSVFLKAAKTQVVMIVTVTALVFCLTGYAVLIPAMRLWGAVVTTIATFSLMLVMELAIGLWQKRLRLEAGPIGWTVALAVGVVALRGVVPETLGLWAVLWRAGLAAAFPVVLLSAPGMGEERELVRRLVRLARRG